MSAPLDTGHEKSFIPSKPPLRKDGPPDDVLPEVTAPSAGFILQLFLIPMIIVLIIVVVWLMFNWLAHLGSDPRELVRDLSKLNDASWQNAYTLSNMLRNPDYDYLKDDVRFNQQLAAVLDAQIDAGSMDDNRVRLRVFLCRALGEFRVTDGLPVLIKAAGTQRDPAETDVRYASLEAIAVLAKNSGAEQLRDNEDLMQMLRQVSLERGEAPDDKQRRDELRSTAAYTLGVIGGPQALDRLHHILDDPYANARYNAATGLARHGDARAVPVLLEMLDPHNEHAVLQEQSASEKDSKRIAVLVNAIRATEQLAEKMAEQDSSVDLGELQIAVERLAESDSARVRTEAQEALLNLKQSKS